jgi:flagellar FliL protein
MSMDADGGEGDAPKAGGGKKKLIIIAGAAVLVLALAGGGAFFFLSGGEKHAEGGEGGEHGEVAAAEEEHKEEPVDPHAPPVFVVLPEILVNLTTSERRPSFLKLGLTLELNKAEDLAEFNKVSPRITDAFQVYLRELHATDLKGSAGSYRLREELLTRVGAVAHPLKIRDVLITDLIVQ